MKDFTISKKKTLPFGKQRRKKNLRSAAVVPLLVEAIKEQQKQIDELKSIINGSS